MAPMEPKLPDTLAILPLRQQVIFPYFRGSVEISKTAYDDLCQHLELTGSAFIGVATVKKAGTKDKPSELFDVGTICRVISQRTSQRGRPERAAAPEAAPPGASHALRPTAQQQAPPASQRPAGAAQGKNLQLPPNPKQRVRIIVEGVGRFRMLSIEELVPVRVARVAPFPQADGASNNDQDVSVRALTHSIREKISEMLRVGPSKDGGKHAPTQNPAVRQALPSNPQALAGFVGSMVFLSLEERQSLLEQETPKAQLELAFEYLLREAEASRVSNEITTGMAKNREMELQRMVLQRQMQEVQRDLQRLKAKRAAFLGNNSSSQETDGGDAPPKDGFDADDDDDEGEDEVARLSEKLSKAGLSEEAERLSKRELRRLKTLQPSHPEYTNTHTYLELMASLPWKTMTEDEFDLQKAKLVLDEDHKGLHQVKRRLLEFLAVQKLRGDMKGPILCLHGPPGIGKTSLGRSIARALNRKFHRIALGGVKDEAEIRGHRRTYIGSMPGNIIQALQSLGAKNPVILLDEVDKMAQNSMFNPQATLLEVLDPEQNNHFKDHYLNTPFDLSKALFICTANDSSTIDRPLLDRMEVIELSGYTLNEKVSICSSHLLPKQRRLHALEGPPGSNEVTKLSLTNDAIVAMITKWTSESGVRSLERQLAQVCRWASLRLQGMDKPRQHEQTTHPRQAKQEADKVKALRSCGPSADGVVTVDAMHLPYILGAELFEPDLAERLSVGVAMGLSVSSVGGQLLFIEAAKTFGRGRLTITGQLGNVMTESVQTALSLLRGRFVHSGRGRSSSSGSTTAGSSIARGTSSDSRCSGASRSSSSSTCLDERPSRVLSLLSSRRAPDDAEVAEDADRDPFRNEDIHVHFPAGAIPKDGPSAGVAVLLALASVLLDRPMRSDTAVTGEVTLRGHVLPVGGIRDKVLAAHRAGVKHVLLPMGNKRHVLETIPANALEGIQVHYMKTVEDALKWAFDDPKKDPKGLDEEEVASASAAGASGSAPAAWSSALTLSSSSCSSWFFPPEARL
eukprot:CAMPEP_0206497024 /NCGR_PEP_ID=MMETSP0324_2-20121206/49876_1 /ASSEMBLY_ACC=CAM_ASM_000836 /TAXON_ID=2866 /ORGANISM="Crypthecodinium cohnii, Strain Seligo" /LENGTH=1024 /DNA_ID=CAMNT_0053982389 /DNA_START=27 /DNA_END=3102 /DNA_ORIENTATION=-